MRTLNLINDEKIHKTMNNLDYMSKNFFNKNYD